MTLESLFDESEETIKGYAAVKALRSEVEKRENSELLEQVKFEGDALTKLRKLVRRVIRSAPEDVQLEYFRQLTEFFNDADFQEIHRTASGDGNTERDFRVCLYDKIFTRTETQIRLLKYLQGGENPVREFMRRQSEIEKEFGLSHNGLQKNLKELQDGTDILGTHVQITLQDGNNYDYTVHPIFLALNISELYMVTATLKEALGARADNILADIYRQLSDYAKDKFKSIAENGGMKVFDGISMEACPRAYRKEKPEDFEHLLKTQKLCRAVFDGEPPKEHIGYIDLDCDGFFFVWKDGENEKREKLSPGKQRIFPLNM